MFKKGNVPANHRPIGSERITVDGFVEIKVVPHIIIVNSAAKCPAVFLCSMLLLPTIIFFKEYFTIYTGGKPDKTIEIVSKMALV